MTSHTQLLVKRIGQSEFSLMRHVKSSLTSQGERGTDSLNVTLAGSEVVREGDEVRYLVDVADLDDLRHIYPFDGNTEDQIRPGGDATQVTNVTFVPGRTRQCAQFVPGSQILIPAPFSVQEQTAYEFSFWLRMDSIPPDDNDLRFLLGDAYGADPEDVSTLIRPASMAQAALVSIWYDSGTGEMAYGYFGNTLQLLRFGQGRLNDLEWHHIRITGERVGRRLYIKAYVDGESALDDDLLASSEDLIVQDELRLGHTSATGLSFSISGLRVYTGVLSDDEADLVYNSDENVSILKFGGRVQSVDDKIATKEFEAFSYGGIVGNVNVLNKTFASSGSLSIISSLVSEFTDLTVVSAVEGEGVDKENFVADGNLYDILSALALENNWTFRTDYRKRMLIEPIGRTNTHKVFRHGEGCILEESGYDDYGLINQVYVFGATNPGLYEHVVRKRVEWAWYAPGTDSTYQWRRKANDSGVVSTDELAFKASNPNTPTVYIDPPENNSEGHEVLGEVRITAYRGWDAVAADGSVTAHYPAGTNPVYDRVAESTFSAYQGGQDARRFRVSATHPNTELLGLEYPAVSEFSVVGVDVANLRPYIRYVFDVTVRFAVTEKLAVQQDSYDSQVKYGIHSKRFTLPHINSTADATKFARDYLDKHDAPSLRIIGKCKGVSASLEVNDVVWCQNELKGIDGHYVVKSVKWKYPEAMQEIEFGEYKFNEYELHKEIVQRIHGHDPVAQAEGGTLAVPMPVTNFVIYDKFTHRQEVSVVARWDRGSRYDRREVYA